MTLDDNNCTTCKRPLPIKEGDLTEVYFACDETMGLYCATCWDKEPCEKEHGEGCMTQIFGTGKED